MIHLAQLMLIQEVIFLRNASCGFLESKTVIYITHQVEFLTCCRSHPGSRRWKNYTSRESTTAFSIRRRLYGSCRRRTKTRYQPLIP
ncbi:hypothetical protein HanRHA438_Chr03g0130961 [Helianthus annuus]|nr:hypothetical protein HanRHA438_Chr03g0130961 [Helianthus annuus]